MGNGETVNGEWLMENGEKLQAKRTGMRKNCDGRRYIRKDGRKAA